MTQYFVHGTNTARGNEFKAPVYAASPTAARTTFLQDVAPPEITEQDNEQLEDFHTRLEQASDFTITAVEQRY